MLVVYLSARALIFRSMKSRQSQRYSTASTENYDQYDVTATYNHSDDHLGPYA